MMRWVRAAVRSWARHGSAGESPRQPIFRVGDDPDVHAVAAVLGRVAGPVVADAVAFGESAVQQDELAVCLPRDLQRARRSWPLLVG
jgi:hypothetical protein